MAARLLLALCLAAAAQGCLKYEYEHEFWLRVDGSGTVNVTGRPELWTAFKGLGRPEDPEGTATREAARALFESSGLRVKRVTITRRGGRPYLFVSADFTDVNALSGTPAFPDLRLALRRQGENLHLEGDWARPASLAAQPGGEDGLMAVRFHLPSKVYDHKNAVEGVERGNIVGWRQEVASGLRGGKLPLMALIDSRSILASTLTLFGLAIVLALAVMAAALYWVIRKGRRRAAAAGMLP